MEGSQGRDMATRLVAGCCWDRQWGWRPLGGPGYVKVQADPKGAQPSGRLARPWFQAPTAHHSDGSCPPSARLCSSPHCPLCDHCRHSISL